MQIDNQSLILGGCNTFLKVKFYFNIYIVVLLYSQERFSKGVKYPNRKGSPRIGRPFWKLLFWQFWPDGTIRSVSLSPILKNWACFFCFLDWKCHLFAVNIFNRWHTCHLFAFNRWHTCHLFAVNIFNRWHFVT